MPWKVICLLLPPSTAEASYLLPQALQRSGGKERERHRETRGGIIFRPKTKESLSSDDKTLSWEGSYTIAPQNSGPSWCRRVKSPNDGQDCDLYVGQCQASKFWILQPRGRWSFCIMFFFLSVKHYSGYAMLAWRFRNWEEPTKLALFGLCSLTVDVLPEGGAVMYFLSTLNVVKWWVHFRAIFLFIHFFTWSPISWILSIT